MNFECLELLGLNQTYEFWGDNINYRTVQDYSARGRISGDPNAALVGPAWSGMSGIMAYSSGYLPIYAQGILLGTGKFTQLSFEGAQDVRNKPFTTSFQILKSGDLSNITGSIYSGLAPAFDFFPYLNSFTEDYQYSQSNNLTTEVTRNISFDLEKNYTSQISGAHLLSSRILSALANLGIYSPPVPPHFSGVEGVVSSVSQSLDTINGNFSYSESFNYQSGRSYVHDYQHSLNYGEGGITTLTEQGTVQGNRRLAGTGDRMQFTNSGWAEVMTGVFPRVSGVFVRWQDQFQNSGCPLDSSPYEKSITKDYSRGLLSYNYSYNNDPSYVSGIYHSYEQTLNYNDNGWIEVGVGGEIRRKNTDPSGALDFIYNFYTGQVKPRITGYATTAYSGSINYFKSPFCASGSGGYLSLLNSEENYSDRPAKINYDYNFTDDPSYIPTGLFRRIKNTTTNQEVTALVGVFKLVNFKELPQNSFQSNLGVFTNNIEIVGSSGVSIDQYKSAASGRIITPTGEYWMIQNTYNYSPFEDKFSMTVGYNYTGYREINNWAV